VSSKSNPSTSPNSSIPPTTKKAEHGVLLKIVSTNILRLRPAHGPRPNHRPRRLVLGHEITGEVIEAGRDVEFMKKGDLVSVPFNIACGRCRNCFEGKTGVCLTVNPPAPARPTATSIWAAGSADRPNMSWSPTPISTC